MTDIDFDELDRAVNSLMQPKQPSVKPEAQPPESDSISETVHTQSPADEPAVAQPDSLAPASDQSDTPVETVTPVETSGLGSESAHAEATQDSAETPKVKVSTKRRGQFMDVMHASSDMKQADPAPKLAPRKSTVTLQPSTNLQSTQPAKSTTVSEPVKAANPAPTETAQAEWTDPIDMMTRHEDKLAAANSVQSSPEQPITPITPVGLADNEPLSSPFLPDTKVDKRPLGGVQPSQGMQAEPVSDPELTDINSETDQKSAEADSTALPEELQQDVLAIESSMAAKANQEAVTATKAAQQAEEAAAAESTSKTSQANPIPAKPVAVGHTSLPQSPLPPTKEVDAEPNSSIFDTEQYQAPIKHPVKRKSWPVIVAIIALVALGTGGGIAFYLLSNGW